MELHAAKHNASINGGISNTGSYNYYKTAFDFIDEGNFAFYINTPLGVDFLGYLKKQNKKLWVILAQNERNINCLTAAQKQYLLKTFNSFYLNNARYNAYVEITTEKDKERFNHILRSKYGDMFLTKLAKEYPGLHHKFISADFKIEFLQDTDCTAFLILFNQFFKNKCKNINVAADIARTSPALAKKLAQSKQTPRPAPDGAGPRAYFALAAPLQAASVAQKTKPAKNKKAATAGTLQKLKTARANLKFLLPAQAAPRVTDEAKLKDFCKFYDEAMAKPTSLDKKAAETAAGYLKIEESSELRYFMRGLKYAGIEEPNFAQDMFGAYIIEDCKSDMVWAYEKRLLKQWGYDPDNTSVLQDKKTGKILFFDKRQIINYGRTTESMYEQILASANTAAESYNASLEFMFRQVRQGNAYVEAERKFKEKYGPGTDVALTYIQHKFYTGSGGTLAGGKYAQTKAAALTGFKQTLFNLISYRINKEGLQLTEKSHYMLLATGVFLKLDFVKGPKTLDNIKRCLAGAGQFSFKKPGTQNDITSDAENPPAFAARKICDAVIDIEGAKGFAAHFADSFSAHAAQAGSTLKLFTDATAGAFKGLLIDMPKVMIDCGLNPLLAPLFFFNVTTPDGFASLKQEFFEKMKSTNTGEVAAYISFNAAMAVGMLKHGGEMAKHGIKSIKNIKLKLEKNKTSVIINGEEITDPQTVDYVLRYATENKWRSTKFEVSCENKAAIKPRPAKKTAPKRKTVETARRAVSTTKESAPKPGLVRAKPGTGTAHPRIRTGGASRRLVQGGIGTRIDAAREKMQNAGRRYHHPEQSVHPEAGGALAGREARGNKRHGFAQGNRLDQTFEYYFTKKERSAIGYLSGVKHSAFYKLIANNPTILSDALKKITALINGKSLTAQEKSDLAMRLRGTSLKDIQEKLERKIENKNAETRNPKSAPRPKKEKKEKSVQSSKSPTGEDARAVIQRRNAFYDFAVSVNSILRMLSTLKPEARPGVTAEKIKFNFEKLIEERFKSKNPAERTEKLISMLDIYINAMEAHNITNLADAHNYMVKNNLLADISKPGLSFSSLSRCSEGRGTVRPIDFDGNRSFLDFLDKEYLMDYKRRLQGQTQGSAPTEINGIARAYGPSAGSGQAGAPLQNGDGTQARDALTRGSRGAQERTDFNNSTLNRTVQGGAPGSQHHRVNPAFASRNPLENSGPTGRAYLSSIVPGPEEQAPGAPLPGTMVPGEIKVGDMRFLPNEMDFINSLKDAENVRELAQAHGVALPENVLYRLNAVEYGAREALAKELGFTAFGDFQRTIKKCLDDLRIKKEAAGADGAKKVQASQPAPQANDANKINIAEHGFNSTEITVLKTLNGIGRETFLQTAEILKINADAFLKKLSGFLEKIKDRAVKDKEQFAQMHGFKDFLSLENKMDELKTAKTKALKTRPVETRLIASLQKKEKPAPAPKPEEKQENTAQASKPVSAEDVRTIVNTRNAFSDFAISVNALLKTLSNLTPEVMPSVTVEKMKFNFEKQLEERLKSESPAQRTEKLISMIDIFIDAMETHNITNLAQAHNHLAENNLLPDLTKQGLSLSGLNRPSAGKGKLRSINFGGNKGFFDFLDKEYLLDYKRRLQGQTLESGQTLLSAPTEAGGTLADCSILPRGGIGARHANARLDAGARALGIEPPGDRHYHRPKPPAHPEAGGESRGNKRHGFSRAANSKKYGIRGTNKKKNTGKIAKNSSDRREEERQLAAASSSRPERVSKNGYYESSENPRLNELFSAADKSNNLSAMRRCIIAAMENKLCAQAAKFAIILIMKITEELPIEYKQIRYRGEYLSINSILLDNINILKKICEEFPDNEMFTRCLQESRARFGDWLRRQFNNLKAQNNFNVMLNLVNELTEIADYNDLYFTAAEFCYELGSKIIAQWRPDEIIPRFADMDAEWCLDCYVIDNLKICREYLEGDSRQKLCSTYLDELTTNCKTWPQKAANPTPDVPTPRGARARSRAPLQRGPRGPSTGSGQAAQERTDFENGTLNRTVQGGAPGSQHHRVNPALQARNPLENSGPTGRANLSSIVPGPDGAKNVPAPDANAPMVVKKAEPAQENRRQTPPRRPGEQAIDEFNVLAASQVGSFKKLNGLLAGMNSAFINIQKLAACISKEKGLTFDINTLYTDKNEKLHLDDGFKSRLNPAEAAEIEGFLDEYNSSPGKIMPAMKEIQEAYRQNREAVENEHSVSIFSDERGRKIDDMLIANTAYVNRAEIIKTIRTTIPPALIDAMREEGWVFFIMDNCFAINSQIIDNINIGRDSLGVCRNDIKAVFASDNQFELMRSYDFEPGALNHVRRGSLNNLLPHEGAHALLMCAKLINGILKSEIEAAENFVSANFDSLYERYGNTDLPKGKFFHEFFAEYFSAFSQTAENYNPANGKARGFNSLSVNENIELNRIMKRICDKLNGTEPDDSSGAAAAGQTPFGRAQGEQGSAPTETHGNGGVLTRGGIGARHTSARLDAGARALGISMPGIEPQGGAHHRHPEPRVHPEAGGEAPGNKRHGMKWLGRLFNSDKPNSFNVITASLETGFKDLQGDLRDLISDRNKTPDEKLEILRRETRRFYANNNLAFFIAHSLNRIDPIFSALFELKRSKGPLKKLKELGFELIEERKKSRALFNAARAVQDLYIKTRKELGKGAGEDDVFFFTTSSEERFILKTRLNQISPALIKKLADMQVVIMVNNSMPLTNTMGHYESKTRILSVSAESLKKGTVFHEIYHLFCKDNKTRKKLGKEIAALEKIIKENKDNDACGAVLKDATTKANNYAPFEIVPERFYEETIARLYAAYYSGELTQAKDPALFNHLKNIAAIIKKACGE